MFFGSRHAFRVISKGNFSLSSKCSWPCIHFSKTPTISFSLSTWFLRTISVNGKGGGEPRGIEGGIRIRIRGLVCGPRPLQGLLLSSKRVETFEGLIGKLILYGKDIHWDRKQERLWSLGSLMWLSNDNKAFFSENNSI